MVPTDPSFLIWATLAFVLAGTIKGLVGIGLPTASIALLTLMISPRLAIVLLLLPMIATNAWQIWRMGQIWRTVKRYIWFLAISAFGVWFIALSSAQVADRVLFACAGVVILIFVTLNFAVTLPPIPDRLDRTAQIIGGSIAGVMGGLTSLWAPPIVAYLLARQVDKDETVRATGLLIFLASLPLTVAYFQNGHMTLPLAGWSAVMTLPALAGFAVGEWLRGFLDQATFRQAILGVFCVLGLNLLRRAFFG